MNNFALDFINNLGKDNFVKDGKLTNFAAFALACTGIAISQAFIEEVCKILGVEKKNANI